MFDVRVDLHNFEKEVEEYEAAPVETGKIIFYGDSYFTRWKPKYGNHYLEDDIRGKNGEKVAINHGLGGSTVEALLYYYPRMVRPYAPKALIIKAYCNDRDVSYSASEVIYLTARLVAWTQRDFPDCRIYICDCAPIAKDKDVWGIWGYHQAEYNEMLEEFARRHPEVTILRQRLIEGFYTKPEYAGDYTKVRCDLYIEDKVHLTPEAYKIYADFFRKELADIL